MLWYLTVKMLDQKHLDAHDEYNECSDFVSQFVSPAGYEWLKHYAWPLGMPKETIKELVQMEFDSRWCGCGCYLG